MGWYTPKGASDSELFETDFLPVMRARAGDEPIPTSFDDSRRLGRVVSRIAGSDNKPVWIVNGDKDVAEHDIDFDARNVWKILVGGTKLSRGFTVEGLTISYYRRRTQPGGHAHADGSLVRLPRRLPRPRSALHRTRGAGQQDEHLRHLQSVRGCVSI